MKPLVYLAQPPFVQLNSPYPAVFYLRSFLERRGCAVYARDHSIGLFENIFCAEGLRRIFARARHANISRQFRRVVKRFLDEEELWLFSIDKITGILRGREKEWAHFLCRANGAIPGGPRFDACVTALREIKGCPLPEDAPLLAGKLLADIADFITVTLDSGFSLIRYTPSPLADTSGYFRDFNAVRAGLDGYIMKNFYRPFLESEWNNFDGFIREQQDGAEAALFAGITIPFPGCLAGALVCAESAKARYGGRIRAIAGGGYVNTELRFITDETFFNYFDYLSFDRGYGSLAAILEKETRNETENSAPLYKTVFSVNSKIIAHESINGKNDAEKNAIDDSAALSVFPDYSGVDFARYICPVDDTNPMHRLWSDGRWIKAYAAHGCYWKKCAFCDVTLDYIKCYKRVDTRALFKHLLAQSKICGVRGIHLVDEACPPVALKELALLNRGAGLPLVFWGNIRFEKTFTREAAELLAAGGFIGFSAGIEVASESGFDRIGKGTDLAAVVNACAAFKEAGLLVHAYLIYGYYDSDEEEIINCAEILRQLFDAGLLDSAFWHQFSLTIHSRLYAEKSRGLHPALRPQDNPLSDNGGRRGEKIFALNDLSFKGEDRFDKYGAPLDALLARWMRGDTRGQVAKAFPFKVVKPTAAPNLVQRLLRARKQ